MRFQERYGITTGTRTVTQPAWVCRCGDEIFVRMLVDTGTVNDMEPGLRDVFSGNEQLRQVLSAIRRVANTEPVGGRSLRRQAKALLSRRFGASEVAVLAADDHAAYLAANPPACAMTGYREAEIVKMTVWELSAPPQRRPGQRLWRVFMTNGMTVGRYRLLKRSGEIIAVEYAAATHVLPGIHVSVLTPMSAERSTVVR
jgi:PAS domain S-box-containing protein